MAQSEIMRSNCYKMLGAKILWTLYKPFSISIPHPLSLCILYPLNHPPPQKKLELHFKTSRKRAGKEEVLPLQHNQCLPFFQVASKKNWGFTFWKKCHGTWLPQKICPEETREFVCFGSGISQRSGLRCSRSKSDGRRSPSCGTARSFGTWPRKVSFVPLKTAPWRRPFSPLRTWGDLLFCVFFLLGKVWGGGACIFFGGELLIKVITFFWSLFLGLFKQDAGVDFLK